MTEPREPGLPPQPPVDYEAMAVAEAQQPLLEAAATMRDYGITFDETRHSIALDIVGADARRRYNADPEAFIASAQSVGAVGLGAEVEPPAIAEPSAEKHETRRDPAVDFANSVAISYMYFDVGEGQGPLSGANERYRTLEPKDGTPAVVMPYITLRDLEPALDNDTQHEAVHVFEAVDDRRQPVAYAKAFPAPGEETPKLSWKEKREARREAKAKDDEDRDTTEKAVVPGNVREVGYAAGDDEGALLFCTLFMSDAEAVALQDRLEEDPRFLRRAVGHAMSNSQSKEVRTAWAAMQARFAEWDQADATLELWDQTDVGDPEPETVDVPAVAGS